MQNPFSEQVWWGTTVAHKSMHRHASHSIVHLAQHLDMVRARLSTSCQCRYGLYPKQLFAAFAHTPRARRFLKTWALVRKTPFSAIFKKWGFGRGIWKRFTL